MNVLVTGSDGSLMRATIPHLLAAGHDVRGVDYAEKPEPPPVTHGRYTFERADLTDPYVAERAVAGCDAVIQAAATIYGVTGFHRFPGTILANDLALHAGLLRAAQAAGAKRFVYISSSMVYERCTQVPVREENVESSTIPATDYGLSKVVGERMCRAFSQEFGLDYTIWRPFNIITPFEEAASEPGISHVFADFINAICVQRRNPMPILGDGEQVRCFTWIDDIAAAVARYSFGAESRNQTINLGNPEPVTMKELAASIFRRAQAAGRVPADAELRFRHLPVPADDVRMRVPDISRAQALLGWQPHMTLQDALDRCVEHVLSGLSVAAGREGKDGRAG